MDTSAAVPLTVTRPDEGWTGGLVPGLGVVLKVAGPDTGGAITIVELQFDVGVLIPPHLHRREDEYSIVVEGEIGVRSGDREVVVGPGCYVAKPRSFVHAIWNAGKTPARTIEVISPAGFEEYFRGLSDLAASGRPGVADVVELAGRFELEFAQPEWLPELVNRFHLTPPPART
jgi:mannose-6-phosphate isomerase-like protein (cupin superfamily)